MPSGGRGTWVVFDGKLAQIGPNDTFHETKDGKFITVLGEEPDLSKCPPELRTKIRKAIADARARKGGGKVVTKYIVDGKEMDRASAQKSLREAGLELTISVDLDAFHYRAIGYGKDRDHLVLTPKRGGGGGAGGGFDPKTNLPCDVLLPGAKRRGYGRSAFSERLPHEA